MVRFLFLLWKDMFFGGMKDVFDWIGLIGVKNLVKIVMVSRR